MGLTCQYYQEGINLADETTLDKLKAKLHRALRHKAILQERSKLLAQQIEDARRREDQSDHLVNEVLERQRELSFMLHRANTVLHRMQEANVALSAEFHDLVKELPEPDAPGWDDRVAKINDLFKKTGALADEADGEIFGKKHESSTTSEEDDPPPATPVYQHEPDPEPVAVGEVQQLEQDRSEVLHAAETIDQPMEAEQITEATFTPAKELETERMDRIERLFGSQAPARAEEPQAEAVPEVAPRRPGLFRRMLRKMTGQSRKTSAQSLTQSTEHLGADQSDHSRSSAA
jgi:hypothetical protein